MQLISPALVGATRSLIVSQGGNPFLINDRGELNPDGIVSLFFNTVEVRTSITPPLRFPIGPTGAAPDPASDALIKSLKPTVIFTGPAGEVVVAPYGTEVAQSWWPIALAGVAVCGVIGWLIFGGRR